LAIRSRAFIGCGQITFTIDTYQHVLLGMQADAARTFEHLVVGDDLLPAASFRQNTREKRREKAPATR
jgi:hypothetical protein